MSGPPYLVTKSTAQSDVAFAGLLAMHAGAQARLLQSEYAHYNSADRCDWRTGFDFDGKMKILLVEDDVMIGENIQIALDGEGIAIDWVKDGNAADAALATHTYDAVLLDLGLPGKDGIELLRAMRARADSTPVMAVTARDTVPERVLGLKAGADDYLIKPFDLEELIARLHALVRRARGNTESVYRNGDVLVNAATRQVLVGDRQVILSSREWAILDALVARPGAILSRSQLEERLYGWSSDVESNAIEVYIHGLRKKLGQQFVINVRGLGYMVEKA